MDLRLWVWMAGLVSISQTIKQTIKLNYGKISHDGHVFIPFNKEFGLSENMNGLGITVMAIIISKKGRPATR